jgi:large conductance mechanosensitive channel
MATTKPTSTIGEQTTTVITSTVPVALNPKTGKPYARKRRQPTVQSLLDTDDLVKQQFGGFVDFIREHAIVGLAVGFIIGQQAQGVIKQLVASFITPILTLILGGVDLTKRHFMITVFHNTAEFDWGLMVLALINLFFVLVSIYALIKIFNLDKLDKPQT